MSDTRSRAEKEADAPIGCAMLVLEPLTWWLWAYVATTCWHWFVLPIFPAAPNPSRAQAAGIWLTLQAIRGAPRRSRYDGKHGEALFGAYFSAEIAHPLFALLIAWIIKRWWL